VGLPKTPTDSILVQRVATKITGFSWMHSVQHVVFVDVSSYDVYELIDLDLV
jgi:hypothetical protein